MYHEDEGLNYTFGGGQQPRGYSECERTLNTESELRAPDPTLDGHSGPFQVELYRPLPVAHLDADREPPATYCGVRIEDPEYAGVDMVYWPGRNVAYIAVPCRECFPDVPPAGWRTSEVAPVGADGRRLVADQFLHWQVSR